MPVICCFYTYLIISVKVVTLAEDQGADSKGHPWRCLFFPADIFQFVFNLCYGASLH